MKTRQAIFERFERKTNGDMFGFTWEVLSSYLSFEQAQELDLVKEGVSQEQWIEGGYSIEPTQENVIEEMREYMDRIGWSKCINERGIISANRTIIKMKAWMWILEDKEGLFSLDEIEYEDYGAAMLFYISTRFGFPIPPSMMIYRNAFSEEPSRFPGLEGG